MFKEKRDLIKKFRSFSENEVFVPHFDALIDTYAHQESDTISLKSVKPLHPSQIALYNALSTDDLEAGKQAISHVAILKLNGGLGTTMGCEEPKSLVTIRPGFTFLDCILKQILNARKEYQSSIPFLLLNSKATSSPTKDYINKHFNMSFDELFQVNYPRFFQDTHEPCTFPGKPDQEWAPGGHGDVYMALWLSGTLEKLIQQGIRYLFLSNSDNLGAELDLKVLGYMARTKKTFLVEATPRTPEDVKGGTLVRYKDKTVLIERAQIEESELKQFEDITRFPIFNTNNVWVDLKALALAIKQKTLQLPVIANKKVIYEKRIVQLETAMGSAIQCFDEAQILIVPRTRFLPVKTTNDLLLLRSDLFEISEEGHITRNPNRRSPVLPKIDLDPVYFDTVEKMEKQIGVVPSLVDATSLKVTGPVTFKTASSIKGVGIFQE